MDSAAGKLSQTDGLSRVYYLIDRYVESVEFVDGGTESLRKGRPGALLSDFCGRLSACHLNGDGFLSDDESSSTGLFEAP